MAFKAATQIKDKTVVRVAFLHISNTNVTLAVGLKKVKGTEPRLHIGHLVSR